MKIYTNGCSYTYGDELQHPQEHSWPSILAKKLNADLTNDAVCGGSNYGTVYRTIKNLDNHHDLYIIAWTTYSRFTFCKSDNNFEIDFNPHLTHCLYKNEYFFKKWGVDLYKYWYNSLYSCKVWLQQIVQLQAVLEMHNKKYIMLNSVSNHLDSWLSDQELFPENTRNLINFDAMNDSQILDQYNEIQYYNRMINKEKFYKWNDFYITKLRTQFPCAPRGHILEEGHRHMAELLYDFL